MTQGHHSAIVLRVHRPPLHEFLKGRRRAIDLDGLAGFRAADRALLVHVDDERVDRVTVQDEMREGIALGIYHFCRRHLYLEHLMADVARGFEAQWSHYGGLRRKKMSCFGHYKSLYPQTRHY